MLFVCGWHQTPEITFLAHWYCFTSRQYSCCWGLVSQVEPSLNSSKCCAIRFTLGKCDNGTYILNNTPIKFTNLQRNLGLLIKSDLSWSDHYNYICLKAYRSLYLIRRTIPATSSTSSTELKKNEFTLLSLGLTLVTAHKFGGLH